MWRMGEQRYSSTHSLTSALDGGEWSASWPGRFTPRERDPDSHWIGGWMGHRTGMDTVSKRKIPSPCRDLNPDHPIVQPIVSRYTDCAILALCSSYRQVKIRNGNISYRTVIPFRLKIQLQKCGFKICALFLLSAKHRMYLKCLNEFLK
jgi:hypothetical protein